MRPPWRTVAPLTSLLLAMLACGPLDLARDILGRLPTVTPTARFAVFESEIWYVDLAGDDGNPCTSDLPCRTIHHVLTRADDDDQIVVGAGTFREETARSAGTAVRIYDVRLSIRGQGPAATVIDAGGSRTGILIGGNAQVTLRDLMVRNGGGSAPGSCISHRSTGRVRVENVEVRNCSRAGIEHSATGELELINVVVRDAREGAEGFGGEGVISSGPLRIEGGRFTGNERTGIISNDLEMAGGLVEGNGLDGISVTRGSLTGVTIRGNSVHPTLGTWHPGLVVGSEGPVVASELTIERNEVCVRAAEGSALTLVDSSLRDCPVGGLNVEAGAVVGMERTTVAGNGRRFAGTSVAGGITNWGRLAIVGAVIEANHNGGIHNLGELLLRDSWVRGNTGHLAGLSNGGQAVVEGSLFSDNRSDEPAIVNRGVMTLRNSTVSGNPGLGVSAGEEGDLTLDFVTISGNEIGLNAHRSGEAISRIANSLIVLNTGRSDCLFSTAVPLPSRAGTNIDSDGSCSFTRTVAATDLHLDGLADNGGPTQTHALLTGSPALDAAAGSCPSADQRGASRPFGPACDVGSYELDPFFTARATSLEGTIEPPATVTPTGPLAPTVTKDSLCRRGPGPAYETVSSVLTGTQVELVGRGMGGNWWVIDNPRYPGVRCWLPEESLAVDPQMDLLGLPLIPIPPLPTPTQPPGCLYQGPNDNAPVCYPIALCPVPFDQSLGACTP